jgi:hypothetical protein
MSRQEEKIREGAAGLLDAGEEMLAAIIARPRGWTQQMASGTNMIAREFGARKVGAQKAAGRESGLELASPMALAITSKRLIVFSIGSPIGMGAGGAVKDIVSAVALSSVDSIELKRLLLGKIVTVVVNGVPVKLEVNAGADAKGLVEAFEGARRGAALA